MLFFQLKFYAFLDHFIIFCDNTAQMRRLSLLLVLLLSGCQAGSVGGLSFSLGSFERGLWFDHDVKEFQQSGFGLGALQVCR